MNVNQNMHKKGYFLSLFVFISVIFTGCDNTDITPNYIVIKPEDLASPMDMSTFNQEHGTSYTSYQLEAIASQGFKDVWVYANEENLGLWELPCKIPVIGQDSVKIKISPGFRMNGLSNQIPLYLFVLPYSKSFYFSQDNSHGFSSGISFKYSPDVTFPLVESFENSTSFIPRNDGGAPFEIYNDEGENVGLITLKDSVTSFDLVSEAMRLRGYGNQTILQIDYRMDYEKLTDGAQPPEFSVGIRYQNSSGYEEFEPLVNFRYSNSWNTVYVNLTQAISRNASSSTGYLGNVKVSLSGYKTDMHKNINFYFDNIKIVTFE